MFVFSAWQFYKKSDSGSSRKLFRFSLIHLPALMLLMLVNKKYWSSASSQEQEATTQDVTKLTDKRITVLPRGPVVAAQDSDNWSVLHICRLYFMFVNNCTINYVRLESLSQSMHRYILTTDHIIFMVLPLNLFAL